MLKKIFPFIFPIIFFVIAVITISDYGMNWDSPVHFDRGQALLRYLATGRTNYSDLPEYCKGKYAYNARVDYKSGKVCDRHAKVRVSEFQSRELDYSFFKDSFSYTYGHPPLSDIFTAVTNQIFFIKLGWFEDVDAYHLYAIFATFLLALTISVWVNKTFGLFASVIAVLSFYLFPLVLGEQHFNIKDPPMAAFFTISLYFFWLAITKKSAKYMLLSSIAGGISFSTKFNYMFAPFILLPWFALYVGSSFYFYIYKKSSKGIKKNFSTSWKKLPKKLVISLLLFPFIVFVVMYSTWPMLWTNSLSNLALVFKFYKEIGTSSCSYSILSLDIYKCLNTLAPVYFVTTLPIATLFYFGVGFLVSILKFKKYGFVTVLWISFLVLTIIRVIIPGSSIYGGIRQITEFIAPTAMIAGVGGLYIRNLLMFLLLKLRIASNKNRQLITIIVSLVIISTFIPIAIKMIEMHPNENVYFNPLVGGLKGAAEKKIPYYGNSYGNVYLQSVKWLNKNAVKDANISLIWGLGQNLSRTSMREDFQFVSFRSGYTQEGEYLITTMEEGLPVYTTFRYQYVDKFLNPVHIISEEGVPLLKIWKNDPMYIKKGIDIKDDQQEDVLVQSSTEKDVVAIGLEKVKRLKKIEIRFSNSSCKNPFVGTQTFISSDGENYTRKSDEINDFTELEMKNSNADFIYFFAGDEAKYIKFILPPSYTCNFSDINFSVYTFKNLYLH